MARAAQHAVLAGLIVFSFSCLSVGRAWGQCIPALCSLTVSLQSDPSGITLSGSGTAATGMSFGTMQAYGGTVPTGVTKSLGSSNWTISTPFDIKVTCTNLGTLLPCTLLITPTYNLFAELLVADSINTWAVSGTTLNNTSYAVLTTSGTYGAVVPWTFSLAIPFTETSGLIVNSINFLIISN